ncbi:Uncharacterised protein [Klebsiella pneumoniae]|nr:Uncharacterised protein [Klebsiella pneumoniae]
MTLLLWSQSSGSLPPHPASPFTRCLPHQGSLAFVINLNKAYITLKLKDRKTPLNSSPLVPIAKVLQGPASLQMAGQHQSSLKKELLGNKQYLLIQATSTLQLSRCQ